MSRASRRAVIAQRIKKVNRLEIELRQVYQAQGALGYVQLEKPIRNGWIKSFRLREDVLRCKKAKIYREVLAAIVVEIWGREKKYADKEWKRYFNKNRRNIQRPGLRKLSEKRFDKLSAGAKKCFLKRKMKAYKGYKNIYVCILPRYYFVLSFRRAYIRKRRIISPILESREQEIVELLSRPDLRAYSGYHHYNYRLYYDPKKGKRRKVNMALSGVRYGGFFDGGV